MLIVKSLTLKISLQNLIEQGWHHPCSLHLFLSFQGGKESVSAFRGELRLTCTNVFSLVICAEWLHSVIHGSPGESPGGGTLSPGERGQPEHRHRGSVLLGFIILVIFCCLGLQQAFVITVSLTLLFFPSLTVTTSGFTLYLPPLLSARLRFWEAGQSSFECVLLLEALTLSGS